MFDDVKPEVSEISLKTLTDKANKMVELEQLVEEKQASLKSTQKELKTLSEEDIPALLSEVGLSEITLTNGKKISTSAYYYGRITEHNQQEAFEWLQNNGHGDIIKNVVSVSFGRDEDVNAEKLLSNLQDNGYTTNGKKWVEPMTLKAFIREQVESGNDLPLETFNVYVGQKTRIINK
jgi:predicted component of viral defense system (DUF524 family)